MRNVRAKKHLGQHFLRDLDIAKETVNAFAQQGNFKLCLEVGPGMGVLTKSLLMREDLETFVVDIDTESIAYLKDQGELDANHLIEGDFLKLDLGKMFEGEALGIIGNFPYNISTQILFKALDNRDQIKEVLGMFQKEVADRIASPPGSKVYGITSVLLQAFFEIDYLFTVGPEVFDPPPKVQSAVIRLRRNHVKSLDCDEKLFKSVVKMSFNQRRKTMRNSLKALLNENTKSLPILSERPEQLSVAQFISLSRAIQES